MAFDELEIYFICLISSIVLLSYHKYTVVLVSQCQQYSGLGQTKINNWNTSQVSHVGDICSSTCATTCRLPEPHRQKSGNWEDKLRPRHSDMACRHCNGNHYTKCSLTKFSFNFIFFWRCCEAASHLHTSELIKFNYIFDQNCGQCFCHYHLRTRCMVSTLKEWDLNAMVLGCLSNFIPSRWYFVIWVPLKTSICL